MNLYQSLVTVNRAPVDLSAAFDIESGGPGSGRHKTGISDLEKQSVMHLRKSGFQSSKKASIMGTHGYAHVDEKGNTHVFNISKKGFTHSVAPAANPTKFKTLKTGAHSQLKSYVSGTKGLKSLTPAMRPKKPIFAGGPGSGRHKELTKSSIDHVLEKHVFEHDPFQSSEKDGMRIYTKPSNNRYGDDEGVSFDKKSKRWKYINEKTGVSGKGKGHESLDSHLLKMK